MKPLHRLLAVVLLNVAVCGWIPRGYAQDEHDHDDHAGHDHEAHVEAEARVSDEAHDEHAGHDHGEPEEVSGDDHAGHDHGESGAVEAGGGVEIGEDVMREFGIVVSEAGPGSLEIRTTLPGEVQVNEDRQAHIVPRFPGLAIEVRKTIGDEVHRGEVLAVIEGNESLAAYEVKSLIDGTVIDKHITLGEALGEEGVVFTVADLSTVWVALTVFQKDLGDIHEGETVRITSDQDSADGVISYVSPTLDPHTRTALARIVLDNPDGRWRPGMFVTGTVMLGTGTGEVVVPAAAVQTVEGDSVVFVPGETGFITREVRTGRRTKGGVEILSGLAAGERFVSAGAFHLKAEMITGGLDPHAGHGH